jgi:hypothetical protein
VSEERPGQESGERVLVLLDASPGSLAALQAAGALARLLQQRLDALLIEDENLLHLAALPFSCEVGSYTASVRTLERASIEREYRLLAGQLRIAVQQVAAANEIEGSFRVVRGGVREAAVREAAAASFVGLGRAGRFRTPGRRLSSLLEVLLEQGDHPLVIGGNRPIELSPPLVVFYTGSDASRRALALAISMSERRVPSLPLVVAAELARVRAAEHAVQVMLAGRKIRYTVSSLPDPARLRELLRRSNEGTLLLPADAITVLTEIQRTLILVP